MKTLTGTVTYVDNIILAPESHSSVELVDVTDPNAEPTVIAKAFIYSMGRRPPCHSASNTTPT